MMPIRKKVIIFIIITVILFIVSSYFSQKYEADLKDLIISKGVFGEIIYVLIMMTAVIIAPFETLPLLPVAVTLWGANQAAILTIIGWTMGALIAFSLARIFGSKLVCWLADKYDVEEWGKVLPRRKTFWLIVFARFILPVDIISYAVGLFTKMHWFSYLGATLLGVTPFAFTFAHGSSLPISWQILGGVIIFILVIFSYNSVKQQFKLWARENHRL